MQQWLDRLGYRDFVLSPASEDASFRSYLRLQTTHESVIVMDAPPQKEPCDNFIAISKKLRDAGLSAPEVISENLEQGFLILTDFGSDIYLSQLSAASEGRLYADALAALILMQTRITADELPPYDETLLILEMDLFHEWFLGKLLDIKLDQAQQETWKAIKRALVENALAQPQVFVHRDYHSRNLMKIDTCNPGILDFQDAVKGPLTYDLVSLLRDCYIAWPTQRVDQLALEYFEAARINKLVDVKAAQFMRWFNLMGIQRHLKAIGIFARLNIRDGKSDFLKDIPRTLDYIRQVSAMEMSMPGIASLVEELGLTSRVGALAAQ